MSRSVSTLGGGAQPAVAPVPWGASGRRPLILSSLRAPGRQPGRRSRADSEAGGCKSKAGAVPKLAGPRGETNLERRQESPRGFHVRHARAGRHARAQGPTVAAPSWELLPSRIDLLSLLEGEARAHLALVALRSRPRSVFHCRPPGSTLVAGSGSSPSGLCPALHWQPPRPPEDAADHGTATPPFTREGSVIQRELKGQDRQP